MNRPGAVRLALWLAAGLACPGAALACRCVPPGPERAYRNADAVVLGTVTGQAADASVIAVQEAWKSRPGASLTVISLRTNCQYEMQAGHTYLLYLRATAAGYQTSICAGNRLAKDAEPVLRALRARITRRRGVPLAVALATLAWSGGARADAPLAPLPALQTVCSPDRQACARIDRLLGETTVHRAGVPGVLWSMRGAPARLSLSNDGRTLVEAYAGGTLLDLDDGPDTPMLVIRDRGVVVRRVLLRELVVRPDRLPRTASHLGWARYFGVDGRGDHVLETAEGRRLRIALPDGRVIDEGAAPAR